MLLLFGYLSHCGIARIVDVIRFGREIDESLAQELWQERQLADMWKVPCHRILQQDMSGGALAKAQASLCKGCSVIPLLYLHHHCHPGTLC